VHETAMSGSVRIERSDEEEAVRSALTTEEKHLHSKMTNLSLSNLSSPQRPHSPRGNGAGGSAAVRFDL
jgi:hypothetical protein